jgi:hypothetical protein
MNSKTQRLQLKVILAKVFNYQKIQGAPKKRGII